MNHATKLEKPIPMYVSSLIRSNCLGACHGAYRRACSRALTRTSSASCEACQKNRYGLIVVPSPAVTAMKKLLLSDNNGITDARRASRQGTCTTKAVTT